MAFRVMSFNVRLDTEADGDNRWDCRKQHVADVIRRHAPLVVGLQEPHKHQVDWLAAELQDRYACVTGKGRSAVVLGIGKEHCEYNSILYDRHQLDCADQGTIWLSNACLVPYTKFEGSAFPRILTYARLVFKADGRSFTFLCTHFDHEGEQARVKSAQLIVDKLPELTAGGPVILVGDLNAGVESDCYNILSAALQDASCVNGCCTVEGLLPAGTSTFCGFDASITSTIDFIFVGNGFRVSGCGVVPDTQPSGACVSDHRPVLAEVQLV